MTRRIAALLLGAGATMAAAAEKAGAEAARAEAADARLRPVLEAMLAEPLEATSPAGLRTASYLLARRFNRGVDDVHGYVYLLKLLCGQALRLAEQHPDADYQEAAVVLTYNLAADTWPGWGPGQVGPVTEAHRRLGLAAARRNVALAAELRLPPNRRRNGYWILGVQLLADGDAAAAAEAFAESRDLAAAAGNNAGRLMAQGWLHVSAILAGRNERAELDAIDDKLREQGQEGRFYADQYQTALDVLGGLRQD